MFPIIAFFSYIHNVCNTLLMFTFDFDIIPQTRQPVFVRLLQGAFRVSQCDWMSGQQKFHVEACIKTLTDIGE